MYVLYGYANTGYPQIKDNTYLKYVAAKNRLEQSICA